MPNENLEAFTEAAAALQAVGYTVVNPHELNPPGVSWKQAMRTDIAALMQCEGLAYLPGWAWSRGAGLELFVATELGIRCQAWEDWVVERGRSA